MSVVEFYEYFTGVHAFNYARICELAREIDPLTPSMKRTCLAMTLSHLSIDDLQNVLLIFNFTFDRVQQCINLAKDKERAEILYDHFFMCDDADIDKLKCLMYAFGFRDEFTKFKFDYFMFPKSSLDLPGVKANDIPTILDQNEISNIEELCELAHDISSSKKRWMICRWAQEHFPDDFTSEADFFSGFFELGEHTIDEGFELPADEWLMWTAFLSNDPEGALRVRPAAPDLQSRMMIDLYEGRPIDVSLADNEEWVRVMNDEEFFRAAVHYTNLVAVRQIVDFVKTSRPSYHHPLPHIDDGFAHYPDGFFETLEYIYDSGAYDITYHNKCQLRQIAFDANDWEAFTHICEKYLEGDFGETKVICHSYKSNLDMYRNLIKFGSVNGWWEKFRIDSDRVFDKLVLLCNEGGFEVPPDIISEMRIDAMKANAVKCYRFLSSC